MTDWWAGIEEHEAPELDVVECPRCGGVVWIFGQDVDRETAVTGHRCGV